MSFTTKIKEEIVTEEINKKTYNYFLTAYIKYSVKLSQDQLSLTFENPAIARHIYNMIVKEYNLRPRIAIRIQKRFKTKRIYILSITNNKESILNKCKIEIKNNTLTNHLIDLKTEEEIKSYLKGTFLSCGSISDPKTSGYHLELVFQEKKSADFILNEFKKFNIYFKILKRNNKYMVYIKVAEEISDILKLFKSNKALFYFEDIRTKKDHINMVNRLNNCEQANQDKIVKTGMKQLKDINYIKENDLITLLDEKTQIIIEYREKYPELSYQELADVISLESGFKITKSGINHHFIRVRNLVEKHNKKSTAK